MFVRVLGGAQVPTGLRSTLWSLLDDPSSPAGGSSRAPCLVLCRGLFGCSWVARVLALQLVHALCLALYSCNREESIIFPAETKYFSL